MRLEVVNGLISFVGKPEEEEKATRALKHIAGDLDLNPNDLFGNGDENTMDIGLAYDKGEWTVQDCKDSWKKVKKQYGYSMDALSVAKAISKQFTDVQIDERVDDEIDGFLYDGWEADHDNRVDAYHETGRGAAESLVLNQIINETDLCASLSDEEKYNIVFRYLADCWDLTTD